MSTAIVSTKRLRIALSAVPSDTIAKRPGCRHLPRLALLVHPPLMAKNNHLMKNILCIYHGTCMDGFTAAWVVRKALGAEVEFHAATHGDPPPDVNGKNVIIVDFSYRRPVLLEMARKATSMLILDHHKSAEADLRAKGSDDEGPQIMRMDSWGEAGGILNWDRYQHNLVQDDLENANSNGAIIYALFDMNRSGAGIAWDFFMDKMGRPSLIDVVEDRDLWRFKYPATRQLCAAIFSYPYDFKVWDELCERMLTDLSLNAEGAAIERKHHKDVSELVGKSMRLMLIGNHLVPCANLPYTMGSDAGHLMASTISAMKNGIQTPVPFAAYYWDGPDGRTFGLRSLEGTGADVSEIARQYGGGGHKHAAGFRVPFGHELTK